MILLFIVGCESAPIQAPTNPKGQLIDGGAYCTARDIKSYFEPKLINKDIYIGMTEDRFLQLCGQPADYKRSVYKDMQDLWLIYGDVFGVGKYSQQRYYFHFQNKILTSWHE